MRIAAVLAGLAVVGTLAPGCGHEDEPEKEESACPDLTVIGARGSGEEGGDPPGFGGLAGGVALGVADIVKAPPLEWTVAYEAVDYPAVTMEAAQAETTLFGESVGAGIDDALADASAALETCPDTRLMLVGYSQGAVVAHGVAARLTAPDASEEFTAIRERVWGVLLVADPTRDPADDDVEYLDLGGEATRPALLATPNADVSPGLEGRVLSVCGIADTVCSTPKGMKPTTFRPTAAHADSYVTDDARDQIAAWVEGLAPLG